MPYTKKADKTNLKNTDLLVSCHHSVKCFSKFCIKYQLVPKRQYGFRQKHSCTYAIARITELMRQAIGKKSTGQACCRDSKEALDSLDHSIL